MDAKRQHLPQLLEVGSTLCNLTGLFCSGLVKFSAEEIAAHCPWKEERRAVAVQNLRSGAQ